LKLFASPIPTEVGWVQRHSALENAECNYVRMIKPNLIFSHNWHVQPNCQRSLRVIRLSGTLLDRGPAFRPGCPRTCCAHHHRFNSSYRRFCANLLNISNQRSPVKPNLSLRSRPLQLTVGGISSLANPISLTGTVPFKSLALRKISKSGQRKAPEPIRLTGVTSWVLQWLVLVCPLRDSLQGFRGCCLA
jgi:hypothetical protein